MKTNMTSTLLLNETHTTYRRCRPRLPLPSALAIACLAGVFLILAGPAFGERGRPTFQNGTLLSDSGTPLRGARYALDYFKVPPPAGFIESLASRGINALHVYAESTEYQTHAGDNEDALFNIVQRTAASDIYLVVTIGGHCDIPCFPDACGTGGPPDWKGFAYDFWKRYAPRLGEYQHVVFELQNEPWFLCPAPPNQDQFFVAQPYPPEIIEFEATAYEIARNNAPQTPILLATYAFLHDSQAVRADMAAISQLTPIDWNKTGIAFHGYEGPEVTESVIRELNEDYGLVETELQPFFNSAGELSIPKIIAYETTRTSWMSFLRADQLNDATWNQVLDDAYVVWAADEGGWPGDSTPPIGSEIAIRSAVGSSPYIRVDATTTKLVADGNGLTDASRFDVLSSGRYVALRSQLNDKFVDRGPGDHLHASSSTPVAFEWIDLPDGKVALQAVSNWRYVGADHNLPTPILIANRPLVTEPPVLAAAWERFDVEILAPSRTLTVTLAGNGSGSVGSTPVGINCGNDCSESFPQGTSVTLTVAVQSPSEFGGWSGHSDCTDGHVTMHQNRTCIATFNTVAPTCGGLSQQAEDGVLSSVFEVKTSGNRTYIEVPDGTIGGPQGPNDDWKASYCVNVPTTGTYRIHGEVRAPGFAADSFYVRVDAQPESLWVPRPLGNWTTDLVNDTRGTAIVDPVEIFLTAGTHTLEILLREDGTQLDAFTLIRQ